MPNGQTYNQYTKCVRPSGYSGLYLWGGAFTAGFVTTLVLLAVDPGAAPLAAIITGIGYCRWWLYARLVCLGGPNPTNYCTIGLVVRIDTQQDQSGLGKFDTDYTLYLLLPPNPLKGDQDWYNNMNNPTFVHTGELMQDQASPNAPYDQEYQVMRQNYTSGQQYQPYYGFSGESITGYDLVNHNNYQTMRPDEAQALNFLTPPSWQSGYFYNPGDQVNDGNGGIETAIDQGLSGSSTPAWPNPDPRNWQSAVGYTTNDYGTIWRYDGPIPAAGILEVEFEGAGMWNLYQVLLALSPAAVGLAAACTVAEAVGLIFGWFACFIAALIFTAIVIGIGALAGLTDNSAEQDVTNQVGALIPGISVLLVSGTWVWDGGHIDEGGWNELHPVLFAQVIGPTIKDLGVAQENMFKGTPWDTYPKLNPADPAQLLATLEEYCGLIAAAQDPNTKIQQQLPQNGWHIHPLVDGCTPPAQPPPQTQ